MASSPPHGDDSGQSRPSALRSPRARLILLLVALALIGGGVLWFIRFETFGKYQESTNDAYIQADSITVAPKVSGYVDRVFVDENQDVKAGQPLVQIDPRDYRAQAAQSVAQIDVAKANAAGVVAQIAEQRAAVAQAEADLSAANANAAFAAREVERYRPLAASGAETRERLSELQNQATQARARAAAARATLTSAQKRIATLQTQVRQAEAQGEAARAQLSAASTNVEATILRAAVDGRIGDRSVRQGQFVQAASRLMTLVPKASLYVEANFKETQLGLMRVGQSVTIAVDALPGIELPGRVASIAPGTGAQFSVLPPQNATGNFTKIVQRIPVRIAVSAGPETRKLLVPGMSVEVSVDTRSARNAAAQIRREQERHNARIDR
ncbi:HlyD family secretion protein [Sphingobium fuliginis]|uniref:HlyD family secretion protein n=1 Tax=Sphingobium sp. Ndbn-10 TaxID=1667223 RepID=UPI000818A9A8|nr:MULTISPECIES: HlyD family secretion protein [Sphingobium]RYL97996.1 HlyD family secretion protein [Sphingobium fuliginis]WDA34702.1 HlyD family secretion protein [Sphingobium sp. YC-XJ3]